MAHVQTFGKETRNFINSTDWQLCDPQFHCSVGVTWFALTILAELRGHYWHYSKEGKKAELMKAINEGERSTKRWMEYEGRKKNKGSSAKAS